MDLSSGLTRNTFVPRTTVFGDMNLGILLAVLFILQMIQYTMRSRCEC